MPKKQRKYNNAKDEETVLYNHDAKAAHKMLLKLTSCLPTDMRDDDAIVPQLIDSMFASV